MKRKKSEYMAEKKEECIFNIIIDRIEGNYAICEFPNESMQDIEISKIPFAIKPRDVILARYNDKNEIECISIKKKNEGKRTSSRFSKLIRFN